MHFKQTIKFKKLKVSQSLRSCSLDENYIPTSKMW